MENKSEEQIKWEIWEKIGVSKRTDIPKNYGDIFLENIMSQSTSDYTVEDIVRTRYHIKSITPEEVFSFKYDLPMHYGIIEAAVAANAIIIPIVLEHQPEGIKEHLA